MKSSKLKTILILEALAFIALSIFGWRLGAVFTSITAFPFEQIGLGLRALSLSGAAGNVLSLALYAAFCLSPLVYAYMLRHKGRAHAEEWLLPLLSITLFAVLYMMTNPGDIARMLGAASLVDTGKSMLGITVYSILAAYVFLRMMRRISSGSSGSLLRYLRGILAATCMLLVYEACGNSLSNMMDSMDQMAVGNAISGWPGTQASSAPLGLSKAVLLLQYLVGILPYAFDIAIIFAGFGLIDALEADDYGEPVPIAARRIGRICRVAIVSILLSQIFVNLLQLLLGSQVLSSSYSLSLPLISVVLVLAAMLLAGHFERVQQLKDDIDSII